MKWLLDKIVLALCRVGAMVFLVAMGFAIGEYIFDGATEIFGTVSRVAIAGGLTALAGGFYLMWSWGE